MASVKFTRRSLNHELAIYRRYCMSAAIPTPQAQGLKKTKSKEGTIKKKFRKLSKECETQQIVSEFERMSQNGIAIGSGAYLMAQKALIQHHCQNKHIRSAKHVWNELLSNDAYRDKLKHIDYHMVISSFLSNRYSRSALQVFYQMIANGIDPDAKLWNAAIKATSQIQSLTKANELHALIMDKEPQLLKKDEFIQNSLIDLFLKCNDMGKAKQIFEGIDNKQTTVTWNVLMNGMIESAHPEEALDLFDQMVQQGIKRDHFTFCCASKAISSLKS